MASRALDLAQAISNTTGSGALVFAGGPTLFNPDVDVLTLNTATSNAGTILLDSSIIVSGNLSVNGSFTLPELTSTTLDANAAYIQANTGTILAQAAFDKANNATDTWVRDAANSASSYANSAYDQANTATTNAATADQRAVTSGVYANSAYLHANASFIVANTKYSSSGGTISGDVNITGNLNVTGNTVTHSADDLIINDPLILLANNNPGNLLDTGFVAHYIEGGVTKHTGLVRDSSANTFYLFDSYVPHIQETNILDVNDATLRITTLKANLDSDSVLVRGYDVVDHTNNSFSQANTATTNAATADQKAVSAGSYANSAYALANTKYNSSGGTISGDVVISGNTTISGINTIINSYAVFTSNSALKVPVGNTAQRTVGTKGDFRFNEESSQFEGYNGTVWGTVGGGATGAANNPIFYENDTNVTGDYTLTTGKNAMSAGPIEIDEGVTVTVPDGSVWTIV
jgi:hypothetical protein